MVECAAIDHPVGFLDESLHTLPSKISQSQVEVLMFELARLTLGVSMEGREEEVRCLVRDILAKEGILSKSLKPSKSEKKVQGQRELQNLHTAINYDRVGHNSSRAVKLLGQ